MNHAVEGYHAGQPIKSSKEKRLKKKKGKQSKEDLFQTSSAADERREEDATGGIGSTRARERQKQPKGEAITSHHSPSQSPLLTLFRGDDVE